MIIELEKININKKESDMPNDWRDIIDEICGDLDYDESAKPGLIYWRGFPTKGISFLELAELELEGNQKLIGKYLIITRGVNGSKETWSKDCQD